MHNSRPTLDFQSSRKRRLRRFYIASAIALVLILVLSYIISGLFAIDLDALVKVTGASSKLDTRVITQALVYCLTHPFEIANDKTAGIMLIGGVVWLLITMTRLQKLSYHLIHGKEFGDAKWGDIRAFNTKYAGGEDRILSENIRFRYSSDTLRNNNTLVVGGSGAGKTSFVLTPNLLNNHGCNVIVDPKGNLYDELGPFLKRQKNTKTYVLNLCEMHRSQRLNPFLFIRTRTDITRLIKNYIQNTNNPQIKNSTADPFWERSEQMFLESIFLYVWLECPTHAVPERGGSLISLARDWRSVLYLIDEAQFISPDTPPKLDNRMAELAKKSPRHPAVKAYRRYRSGPEETVRSVIMTVNARMQAFDNDDLMRIFSGNDIPLNAFGVGLDGDETTKTNLFIIIPDDDETYNFIPGIVYTLLFQQLYAQARFYGGRLPLDVGFWLDEFANTKMPSNFDRILATCRSRGIYCVPMLQSLSQLKTLFENGAWEGVVGNCDTFLYLGGNEPSTYEYISKALGKWTVDKRTSGESRGSTGSSSENFDVLGRELMMEYEVRLLPDDECILFVRGELPLRDKKWFPWEHEEYKKARKTASPTPSAEGADLLTNDDNYKFVNDRSLEYIRKSCDNLTEVNMSPLEFMTLDLDNLEKNIRNSVSADSNFVSKGMKKATPITLDTRRLSEIIETRKATQLASSRDAFARDFDQMSILDIYATPFLSETRRDIITRLLRLRGEGHPITDDEIKSIIHPKYEDDEVVRRAELWERVTSVN